MKNLIIQPYGMGDHIICNALIRHICSNSGEYALATKHTNVSSVKFMFSDVPNLEIVEVTDDPCWPIPVTPIGISYFHEAPKIFIAHDAYLNTFPDLSFDQIYYKCYGVDFQQKWDGFKVNRDKESEQRLFNSLKIDSDYILVHDDDRFAITRKIWNPETRIIRISKDLTNNVFDYLTLIENAKEIHCIESFLLFLTDTTNTKAKLFSHRYARYYEQHATPKLKLDWEILFKIPEAPKRHKASAPYTY